MYVDPKATGKGYGSALMGRALEEFRKRGVKTVYTETLPKNKRAIRFYERHGFRKKHMVSFKVRGQLFREWRLERAL
jgi:ribosomal protein S18 acetylase RimI-like enzyme